MAKVTFIEKFPLFNKSKKKIITFFQKIFHSKKMNYVMQ